MSESESIREAAADLSPPGPQLAAARESYGLAVADIARQLKLSARQIEALESDDYASLPGAVFVRGFIRNYARLVKLDPAPLLEYTERQMRPALETAPELVPPMDIPYSNVRANRWRTYAIAALVLLVPLALFGIYYDDIADVTNPPEVNQPAPPKVIVKETLLTPEATQAAAPAEPVAQAEEAQAPSSGVQRERIPPAASPQPLHAANDVQPGERLIKFKFDRESWVEIRDRHGRKIFSQINPAGTAQEVSGEPPFTLIVGNAAGVRMTMNDQPVDLAPHIKVDVARLTLD